MVMIREPGGEWERSEPTDFTNEAELQALLAESPQLMPGVDGPVVVAAEMTMPGSGRADLVLVGASGDITIVECKLSSNPDMRRSAIGQLLAYASSMWRLRFEEFRDLFSRAANADLLATLGTATMESGLDWSEDNFRREIDRRLEHGELTLIMAVDEITEEMKNTILYLNHRMAGTASVLAIEAGIVRSGGMEILIPKTYGEESSTEQRPTTERRTSQWDAQSFFDQIGRACSPESAAAVRMLYEVEEPFTHHLYFGDGQRPSVTFWYELDNTEAAVWTFYTSDTGALFSFGFEFMARRSVSTDKLRALLHGIRELPGFDGRLEEIEPADFRKRPSFDVDAVLAPSGSVEAISRLIASLTDRDV